MKNNWLEYKLEKESRDLPWDLKRVQLLESLIGPTAQFGVELENHLGQLTILDYDSYVYAHLSSSCDQNEVWRLVYVDLLKKAVQDANAVALMRRESLGGQAVNLWRSLFQTNVLCQYIGDRLSDDHLTCRYLIHSISRPTVRRWEEVNKTRCRLGEQGCYSPEKIESQKQVYEDVFNKAFDERRQEQEWTLDANHKSFEKLAQATNTDMLFYRIANNEVHPTFGNHEIVTDLKLPLPSIPLLPKGITHDAGELSLEYQTARLLQNTTRRACDYIALPVELQGSLTTLNDLAKAVSKDLRR